MDSTWVTLRGLFRQYPNTDVSTRISIVQRAEELLEPHLDIFMEELRRRKQELSEAEVTAQGGGGETDIEEGADIVDSADGDDYGSATCAEGSITGGAEYETIKGLGVRITPVVDGKPMGMSGKAASDERRSTGAPVSGGGAGSSASGSAVSGRSSSPGAVGDGRKAGVSSSSRDQNSGKSGSSAAADSNAAKSASSREYNASKNPEDVHVQFVKGVGPKLAAVLNKLGINTVAQLLRHYPRRHLDFQNRLLIRDLEEGQEVSIFGMIRSVNAFQSRNRNMSIMTVVISDNTGIITIVKFVGGKSNKYLLDRYKAQYPKGAQVLASGIVERDQYKGNLTLKNSEVEILGLVSDGEEDQQASLHAGRLVPVYPLTDGLSLRYLRTVMHNALEAYSQHIVDPLPKALRSELNLLELTEALRGIHFPDTVEIKDAARRRLVFDELFGIQLQLAHRRYKFDQENQNALALTVAEDGLVTKLIESLPFKLTGAQERVFAEIARDLSSAKPMHRLVQGDVGSGKTVVALLACLIAIDNKFQAAMMAPTEILAEQHYRQFQRLLTPLGLRCALVLGKQGVKERRAVRQDIVSGQVHIAVGTHALLEDDVEFQNLGLIVIDEQHRFGVKQRARLKAKSLNPELLTMTATPIPRTLAMTMHGDLDVSEIDELPPGRKPIKTRACTPSQRGKVWEFIVSEIEKGRQAYIVFPLIDESESLSAKAATKEFEKLKEEFPNLRFGLMHGKLKSEQKDEEMDKFRKGEYDVLVSTTVIEVGVDVPNSSVMMIENADRFGLAQLHQLRGRVGRGADQSYCFLVSDMKSPTTRERLEIMTLTNDGFVVAEKDLELRGPGEFLGYRQSGLPDLILADLVKDASILEEARNTAIAVVRNDPELTKNPELLKLLERKSSSHEVEIMRSG
jgi:ATP-dependent DNA helicase RecG